MNRGSDEVVHALLLDSDPAYFELARKMLTECGDFEVVHAPSVDDARRMLSERGFDVIVASNTVAGVDAVELLRELRASRDNTPFVVLTEHGQEDIAMDALRHGADFYTHKGIQIDSSFSTLSNMIMQLVRRSRAEKAVERLLVESEFKYRTLFDNANDAIYIVDLEGLIIDVNRTACEQTGRKRSELVGSSLVEVDALKESWKIPERINTITRRGGASFEARHVTKDGREFPVEVSATLLSLGGKPVVMGIVRDISERRMAEDALKTLMASLEDLESIVTSTPAVVFRWSYSEEDGRRIQFVSNNVQQFGYSPSELVSNSLSYDHMIHPDDRASVASEISKYHRSRADEFDMEYRIVAKDGTARWVDDRTTVIRDEEGGMVRHQGIVMDITSRKQAEDALKAANEKLNLLGSITRHDIANQLGILSGVMSLLEGDEDEESERKHMGMMREAISVISQQLEFAGSYQRAGSKPPEWILVRLDLAAALGAVDVGGIKVESDLGNLEVWADPMFEKVLYNLLENSVRHGGRTSRVRVFARREKDSCVIVFEDDGAGVPEEDKEKIFNKGFGKNTGHGLFLSREILGITGINIIETGKEGEGSRFEMHVPRGRFRG